jgi:hypothetical protein
MSTVHSRVQIVTDVLYRTCGQYIKFPDIPEMRNISRGFQRYGFPNVICALDGTHISIKPPAAHKNDYCSRKSQFAINLTATCDASLNFTSIFTGYSAKVHDSRVFKASPLFEKLGTVPSQYHILGDAAYALHMAVMTPFKDTGCGLTSSQTVYNYKQSRTRMYIERC